MKDEITCICLDDRQRKIMVGNHKGEIRVCVIENAFPLFPSPLCLSFFPFVCQSFGNSLSISFLMSFTLLVSIVCRV